ncbi:hypothetical protein EST38_g8118 [Candolleomyces aberdarensis]|uniref:Uncharacterized protein n=1 Tax=Candolleomyces aberdarensis TaxID=2316362 RepID=A0A4V1Q388_9AGAR|nr:hypothetical protein EST38_g8118 [Candolleomyces aberdarensis]
MTRSSTHTLSNFSALRNPKFLRELNAVFEPENIFHKMGLVVETRPKNWFLYDYDTEYNENHYGYGNAAATPVPNVLEPEFGPLQSIPVQWNPSLAAPTSPALASGHLDATKYAASPMGAEYLDEKPSASILARMSTPPQRPFTNLTNRVPFSPLLPNEPEILAKEAVRLI